MKILHLILLAEKEKVKSDNQKSQRNYRGSDNSCYFHWFLKFKLWNHTLGRKRQEQQHYSQHNAAYRRKHRSDRLWKRKQKQTYRYSEYTNYVDDGEQLAVLFAGFIIFICPSLTFVRAVLLKICNFFGAVIAFFLKITLSRFLKTNFSTIKS